MRSNSDEKIIKTNIGGVSSINGSESVREHYNSWAQNYERDLSTVGYRLPTEMARILSRYVPEKEARIFDAGCGTGLSGIELAREGYKDIWGIDFSKPMAELAKKKRIYRSVEVGDLTNLLHVADKTFDHAIAIGTIGVAPPAAMVELVRVTKPNGYIIFSNRTHEHYSPEGGFVVQQEALEKSGKWCLVETIKNLVADDKEGSSPFVVFVYKVLE